MTEGNNASSSETRLENTIVCLPVATGSVAFYLGNKSDTQTHEWTLYVRGPSGEDLSVVLEKVIFQLHPSFAQPTRELTEPPYEVTERGWGEFEAQIRLIWKDPSEQSVLLSQPIKLYPPGAPLTAQQQLQQSTETPVVSETYDEIVITNPTESFYQQLQSIGTTPSCQELYSQHAHFPTYSDTQVCQAMLQAQKLVNEHLAQTKQNLIQLDHDLANVEEALRVQQDEVRKKAARKAAQQPTKTPAPTSATTAATTSTGNKKQKTT
ncbi:YEATS domain-containing protein 4 [Fistulifera solaris]|uniref:YEATS domain-containing protein 4 n=1 Tax=Fistulifera solaris TaxID=1519565 RepID=A0A1Z5KN00_FISSO|nr:YEATS domain-containing protein 4 [Fistulifera solaris]|eukprot:GAX27462.1 YEATS domain-containing protein 4 [Fistulifera solaris]